MLVKLHNPVIINPPPQEPFKDKISRAANTYLSLFERPIAHIERTSGRFHLVVMQPEDEGSKTTKGKIKNWCITILKIISYMTIICPLIAWGLTKVSTPQSYYTNYPLNWFQYFNGTGEDPSAYARAFDQGKDKAEMKALTEFLDGKPHEDVDGQGKTAVMRACIAGNLPLIQEMIEQHPNLKAKDNRNMSTIVFAMAGVRSPEGDHTEETLRAMINADPTILRERLATGVTPFLEACRGRWHPICLKVMLEESQGAVLDDRDGGLTPLMMAYCAGMKSSWLENLMTHPAFKISNDEETRIIIEHIHSFCGELKNLERDGNAPLFKERKEFLLQMLKQDQICEQVDAFKSVVLDVYGDDDDIKAVFDEIAKKTA